MLQRVYITVNWKGELQNAAQLSESLAEATLGLQKLRWSKSGVRNVRLFLALVVPEVNIVEAKKPGEVVYC